MSTSQSMYQQDVSKQIETIATALEAAIERRDQAAQRALKHWSGPLAVEFRNAITAENQTAQTLVWELRLKANFR